MLQDHRGELRPLPGLKSVAVEVQEPPQRRLEELAVGPGRRGPVTEYLVRHRRRGLEAVVRHCAGAPGRWRESGSGAVLPERAPEPAVA